jgi:hypothetical protein
MTTPRRALLLQAADTIDGDRNETYGGPESSFSTIAELWASYLEAIGWTPPTSPGGLAPHDVAAMLALLKIARIANSGGTHKDSWLDLAGYAACGWETVDVPVPAEMEPAQDPAVQDYFARERAKVFAPDPKLNAEALKKLQEELQGLRPIGPGTVGWQGVK